VVTAGLGGMGGAQPLAATMNGGVLLAVEVDPARVKRRVDSGYCDRMSTDLDEALDLLDDAKEKGTALSVGLVGNIAEVLPDLVKRGITPDVLTDQTSAHDLRLGYIPAGLDLAAAAELRERDPQDYDNRVLDSMVVQSRSTMVTTCVVRWRITAAWTRRFGFPGSFQSSSGRCSVAGLGRSVGWRSRATRRT